MEFNEKLQLLRKQQGLTQEELAEQLYVSRTAVSKWESGRGWPSLDSLLALSRFFSVSLDALLSSEAGPAAAEDDQGQQLSPIRGRVSGLLDCGMAGTLFLPVFALRTAGSVQVVPLLSLTGLGRLMCAVPVGALVLCGIWTLAVQSSWETRRLRWQRQLSLGLSATAVLCFLAGLHPYAATLALLGLLIKGFMALNGP